MFFSVNKELWQGCTKPKTELGMHQDPHVQQNLLKIKKNQKNPPTPLSTITIPESVPRTIGIGSTEELVSETGGFVALADNSVC